MTTALAFALDPASQSSLLESSYGSAGLGLMLEALVVPLLTPLWVLLSSGAYLLALKVFKAEHPSLRQMIRVNAYAGAPLLFGIHWVPLIVAGPWSVYLWYFGAWKAGGPRPARGFGLTVAAGVLLTIVLSKAFRAPE